MDPLRSRCVCHRVQNKVQNQGQKGMEGDAHAMLGCCTPSCSMEFVCAFANPSEYSFPKARGIGSVLLLSPIGDPTLGLMFARQCASGSEWARSSTSISEGE